MWYNVDPKNDGAHYSVMGKQRGIGGMTALRGMFPNAESDEMNLVLFSTSGVHGTYNTIEEAETVINGTAKPEDERTTEITFLVVHPRLVALRYGTCNPKNQNDIDYLKKLRASSHAILAKIGLNV
jgi:hypothetical protein